MSYALKTEAQKYSLALFNLVNRAIIKNNFQVETLGIGGSYHSNTQSNNQSKQPSATFTMFLTNVEAGGATVFPNLGISVWPEKGSALFW